jgi:hypothetical protein
MKNILLITVSLLSFSVKAQQKVISGSVPEQLVGKWVPEAKEKTEIRDNMINSISFFANGKINIDSKKSKIVQGFNAVKEDSGYAIQLTDLINGSPLADFKVVYVTDSTMVVNMNGKNAVRNLVLKKSKVDAYRVTPLKGR